MYGVYQLVPFWAPRGAGMAAMVHRSTGSKMPSRCWIRSLSPVRAPLEVVGGPPGRWVIYHGLLPNPMGPTAAVATGEGW
jgi:hypothetical protein